MSRRGWSWRHCCTKSVCAAHQTSLFNSAPLLKRRVPVLHRGQSASRSSGYHKKACLCVFNGKKKIQTCGPKKKKKIQNTSFSFSGGSRDCSESPPRGVCHLSKHTERERPVSIVGMTLNMFVYRVN